MLWISIKRRVNTGVDAVIGYLTVILHPGPPSPGIITDKIVALPWQDMLTNDVRLLLRLLELEAVETYALIVTAICLFPRREET